ncbi:hypothetical protein NEOLEDRAFT_1081919, partial [Neolentinus lepideus HHB14362 ss-1]
KNVICWVADNMNLKVENDITELKGNIPGKAQRHIDGPVRRLHPELDPGIVFQADRVAYRLRHGDYLASWIYYAFYLFDVSNNCNDGPNRMRLFCHNQGLRRLFGAQRLQTKIGASSSSISSMVALNCTRFGVGTFFGVTISRYLLRTSGEMARSSSGERETHVEVRERLNTSSVS